MQLFFSELVKFYSLETVDLKSWIDFNEVELLARLRPVKFWGKLLRQKIMSSFISSLAQKIFIFAVLIHMVNLINNQALINIHIYYFSHFVHVFGNVST